MIRLRFNSLAGTDPAMLGPAPFFRIEGPLLHQGADHTVVGRYFDHHWELGDRFVSSYECVEPVCLHFAGADGAISETYGPFQQVRFPNGSCYADRILFAEFVEEHGVGATGPQGSTGPPSHRGRWLHRGSLIHWPALVIRPATDPTPR
jgi:hypothetical protein